MRKRTTFYFPPEAASRLGQIKRRSRMESGAAVLRAALSAYAELLEVTQAGYRIVVRPAESGDIPFSPYEPFIYSKLDELRTEIEPDVEDRAPRNFVFPEAAAQKLEAIKNASYLDSSADAIRAALATYDELTLVSRAGDQILIIDPATSEEIAYTPYAPITRHRLRRLAPRGLGEDQPGRSSDRAGSESAFPASPGLASAT